MKWRMIAFLMCAFVVSMAGCSDRLAAPLSADTERAQLVQRARELKVSVAAAGSMTDEHHLALGKLTQDIEAWQTRTGRTDLGFRRGSHVADTASSVSLQINNSPGSSCGWCPPVVVMGDLICFLEAKPSCIPGQKGKCKYVCVFNLDGVAGSR
jgi:hypothetical protein